jgi:hypothetical protein
MANEIIKKMLQDGYNKVAFTDKYILGWVLKHVVYYTVCDRELVDWVTCIDKASRGAGYALRFKPNTDQKYMLMANGAQALCSEELFDDMLKETYVNKKGKKVNYNKGEVFEKLITEKAGQVWEKDTVPFTKAGDIEWNGVSYQIKFEKATFTNEKSLMNLMNK